LTNGKKNFLCIFDTWGKIPYIYLTNGWKISYIYLTNWEEISYMYLTNGKKFLISIWQMGRNFNHKKINIVTVRKCLPERPSGSG
jgi:hypothetical protein